MIDFKGVFNEGGSQQVRMSVSREVADIIKKGKYELKGKERCDDIPHVNTLPPINGAIARPNATRLCPGECLILALEPSTKPVCRSRIFGQYAVLNELYDRRIAKLRRKEPHHI